MGKRMKYGGALLLSFVAGLATYGLLFHSSWCSDTRLKDAALQISTRDLIGVFDKSEELFDKEYLNKTLSVSGIIKKIRKNEGKPYTLYLGDDPDEGPSVSCSLDSFYNDSPLSLKTGDKVTLTGICAGRLMDIILVQCIIEK
jgi:hypothetical protein